LSNWRCSWCSHSRWQAFSFSRWCYCYSLPCILRSRALEASSCVWLLPERLFSKLSLQLHILHILATYTLLYPTNLWIYLTFKTFYFNLRDWINGYAKIVSYLANKIKNINYDMYRSNLFNLNICNNFCQ